MTSHAESLPINPIAVGGERIPHIVEIIIEITLIRLENITI